MLESGRSKWRKLDNAAQAFPAAAGKHDTRVFRFYCQLKEEVQEKSLQEALEKTMEKYPLFQAVLRKGLFWFYLERRDIRAVVKEEDRPPCSKIYVPDQKSLLFEVTYYKNRINFEAFHALTDGTGAMQFLTELVKNYLMLAHPEAHLPDINQDSDVTGSDQEEDSFSQYYSTDLPKIREKKESAFQMRGERLEQDEMQIMEINMSVKEVLAKARGYGVSLTVYLSSILLWAIHEEVPKHKLHKPIALMVPVNLRNYFPSQTMSNFFGWIEVGYRFQEDTTLEEVLAHVKSLFEKELVKERIGMRMNELVGLEKHPLLRIVPLEMKTWFLQAGTTLGGKSITSIYSNVGLLHFPEEYHAYIERFGVFTSTNKLQLCSCSFGDELMLGFTTKVRGTNVQRNFIRKLKQEGIQCREEPNDFPGYKKKPKETTKWVSQTFTFMCVAIAVVCMMINYMTAKHITWSGFVAAGCLCTWLVATVAFYKRRNLLKNGMWQLLLFSGISILWDWRTGWHGWSVDFVLPLASLVVLCSMAVIAKVRRLELAEYLFYLIQACAFGWIPLILLIFGAVRIPYPSVICAGISFLFFIGLVIFRQKEVKQEIHKKFRM